MDRSTQARIFAEINGYIDSAGTRLADAEMYHRATTYDDPAHHEKERALLRRYPVIIGHSASLTEAGGFFTDDSTGVPIIVSRQADGRLKAFVNVCRHRGAPVCQEAGGKRGSFTCIYHGWTYKADGTLQSVPTDAFPNLDRAGFGLVELPVEERHGLIWVVTTPGAGIDVAAHLGALDAELASYGMENYLQERQTVRREDFNWKFVIDGFMELYHFPTLHSKSIAPYFHSKYSPFDGFGRHGRLVAARASFQKARGRPLDEADLMSHIAVNYQIFPNTVLVWQGDHFEVWTSFPGPSPASSIVRIQSLVHGEKMGDAFRSRWDRNWKILIDTVVDEDWAISRHVQKALHFLPDDRIVFGRNEPGMQHFHAQLADAVGNG